MAFWQSPVWIEQTDSIYPLSGSGGPVDTLPPWKEAWRLYRKRSFYDVVLTMGVRESLGYGLLCALTFRPSRQIMTEVFIDAPRPRHIGWRFKTALMRLVAKRAIGMVVFSSGEVSATAHRYRIPESRIRFTPIPSTIQQPMHINEDDGYILAAGRTLRDYTTFLKAVQGLAMPVHIVCGKDELKAESLPSSITIHREIAMDAYLDLLKRCAFVVIPLRAVERSTGQVVLLEAMSYGKAVIATRSAGTHDYITDNEDGLLVEPGNAKALSNAIKRLIEDPALRDRLGRAGHERVSSFNADSYARMKLEAINQLVQSAP